MKIETASIILGSGLNPDQKIQFDSRISDVVLNYSNYSKSILVVDKEMSENILALEFNLLVDVLLLDSPCKGALATLVLAAAELPEELPILALPINSTINAAIVSEFVQSMKLANADAAIIVFRSNNPELSYVRSDDLGNVVEIAEKLIISELATAGVFFFKNKKIIIDCAKWAMKNNVIFNNKFYIAPSLNFLLTTSQSLKMVEIEDSEYHRFA